MQPIDHHRRLRERFGAILRVRPQPLQEAVCALHRIIRPQRGILGRACEHDEQARRVGAVLGDQLMRIDAVLLALGHRADAAVFDALAIALERAADDAPFRVVQRLDLFGREIVDTAFVAALEVAVIEQHSLRHQAQERLVESHEAHVAHHLGPEACVQEMQDRVFDAADVLVHRVPVLVARVDHRRRAGTCVAHVVPRRIDERIHRIGLALRRLATTRACRLDEIAPLRERIAGAVGHAILGQNDRQIGFRHRHVAAGRAVDDRNGRAPVALARDAPIAQAIRDPLLAEPHRLEVGGDGVDRGLIAESVVLARMNASTARLVLVPRLPCIGGERRAVDGDDLLDRQTVLFREREIALVVAGNAHYRALAVSHENVVADPELDLFARERMRHMEAGRHPLLFHRRELGLDNRAALAFIDERGEPRIRMRRVRGERVLGRDRAEGDAHDRVGARREYPQLPIGDGVARCVPDVVREGEAHAFAAADPVGLHRPHALGPAGHLF